MLIFFSASQIPCILWNQKIYYCVYNSPPLVPIPSKVNQVQESPSYFFKIYLLFYHLYLRLASGSFCQVSQPKPRMYFYFPPYVPHAHTQLILLDLTTLPQHIFLTVLALIFPWMWELKFYYSHIKKPATPVVMYILIFIFLGRKWKDKRF